MGINVVWKDERGVELGRVDDPAMLLSRLTFETHKLSKSVCIRFLDPAGDTCFNQLQLPFLAEELRLVASSKVAPPVRKHLQDVLALVERAAKHVHTYVWFIGD